MTVPVLQEGPPLSLGGHTFSLGPEWILCTFPLPTAMPIPLTVLSPIHAELVTWAFTGMEGPAYDPTCLLLIRVRQPSAVFGAVMEIALRTHFFDIVIRTEVSDTAANLSLAARGLVARALLASVTPANVRALVDPLTFLLPALHQALITKEGPTCIVADAKTSSCTLSGTEVPNYILFQSGDDLRCVRVAGARLTFSPKPLMNLELESMWGRADLRPVQAILLGDRRFTVTRVRTAETQ